MSNYVLNLRYKLKEFAVLQRTDLKSIDPNSFFQFSRPAYLYFIMARDRITIHPALEKLSGNRIKLNFFIHQADQQKEESVVIDTKGCGKEFFIETLAPYRSFKVFNEDRACVVDAKTSYLLELSEYYSQIKNKESLDFEILYIGQSVLSGSSFPVLERISSHKTYQEILEDCNSEYPNKDIYLLFFSHQEDVLLEVKEPTQDEKVSFSQSFNKNYFLQDTATIRNHVTLLEAGLINYFKPRYNNVFVKAGPHKKMKGIKSLNELNIGSVQVMFGFENYLPRVYSKSIDRIDEHVFQFKINDGGIDFG